MENVNAESTSAQSQSVVVNNIIQQVAPQTVVITNPDKRFSIGWCIFWILFFWPGAIIQALLYWTKPSTITVVR